MRTITLALVLVLLAAPAVAEPTQLFYNERGQITGSSSEIEVLTFELEWGPDWREAIRLDVSPRTLADRWKARSPFEWVAGHYLPEVFRTHFGTTAKFNRRKGVPDGPAIRFIEQALSELGIT